MGRSGTITSLSSASSSLKSRSTYNMGKEHLFKCDFDGCEKAFRRKDHLKRHKLNHDDKARLYICEECGMKFKRSDVKRDHYNRHLRNKAKEIEAMNFLRESTIYQQMKESKVPGNESLPLHEMEASVSDPLVSETMRGSINDWKIGINDSIFLANNTSPGGTYRLNAIDSGIYDLTDNLVRPDLNFEYALNSALADLLKSDLGNIPTIETNFNVITENHLREFLLLIPQLVNCRDFQVKNLELCMDTYWSIFHIQYPILHRPSFNSLDTPPLLLLAMIMIGACFSKTLEPELLQDPIGLSNEIGSPLRWLIFRHKTCGASNPWEIQSLLILEVFEKNYSSRLLHERSSTHHAAKIEMMKRSTVLGGDPFATESKSNTELREGYECTLWNKWIYAESMKRCALMAFCFDLNSTITSGHQSTLFVNKLRLGLPCDDCLWEANLEELKDMKVSRNSELILTGLKRLLRGENVETTSFGKKVMLHTLTSLMVQFELNDETVAMVSENSSNDMLNDVWRDKLSYALDAWKFNVNEGSCCDLNSLLINLRVRPVDVPGTPYLHLNDTKCKFPSYHMAQIRLRIVPHDMLILAGVPIRMSVKMDDKDYKNVETRLKRWSQSLDGRVSVIHAYLCLLECLLNDQQNCLDYAPEKDPIHERPHIVVSCSLIIWCYNFIERGAKYGENAVEDDYMREDAYNYLVRIKEELYDELILDGTVMDYHMSIKRCALKLPKIKDLNQLAGLFAVISKIYSNCFWEMGKEYSRLLVHCKERFMGKKEPFCTNVYDFSNI